MCVYVYYTCIYIYMYMYIHAYIHTCMHTYIHTYIHSIPFHSIPFHSITLHYITLNYITLHYNTLHTYIHRYVYILYIHIYIYKHQPPFAWIMFNNYPLAIMAIAMELPVLDHLRNTTEMNLFVCGGPEFLAFLAKNMAIPRLTIDLSSTLGQQALSR